MSDRSEEALRSSRGLISMRGGIDIDAAASFAAA
jgi:hypothetical protein